MKNPAHEKWPAHSQPGAQGTEPTFDPDSPDVTDPQIDPPHPPHAPGGDVSTERRAPGHQYPPYSKP